MDTANSGQQVGIQNADLDPPCEFSRKWCKRDFGRKPTLVQGKSASFHNVAICRRIIAQQGLRVHATQRVRHEQRAPRDWKREGAIGAARGGRPDRFLIVGRDAEVCG